MAGEDVVLTLSLLLLLGAGAAARPTQDSSFVDLFTQGDALSYSAGEKAALSDLLEAGKIDRRDAEVVLGRRAPPCLGGTTLVATTLIAEKRFQSPADQVAENALLTARRRELSALKTAQPLAPSSPSEEGLLGKRIVIPCTTVADCPTYECRSATCDAVLCECKYAILNDGAFCDDGDFWFVAVFPSSSLWLSFFPPAVLFVSSPPFCFGGGLRYDPSASPCSIRYSIRSFAHVLSTPPISQ
jgi:hypothetical protein